MNLLIMWTQSKGLGLKTNLREFWFFCLTSKLFSMRMSLTQLRLHPCPYVTKDLRFSGWSVTQRRNPHSSCSCQDMKFPYEDVWGDYGFWNDYANQDLRNISNRKWTSHTHTPNCFVDFKNDEGRSDQNNYNTETLSPTFTIRCLTGQSWAGKLIY